MYEYNTVEKIMRTNLKMFYNMHWFIFVCESSEMD